MAPLRDIPIRRKVMTIILATTGVVLVLYRREFHSDVLQVMVFTQTCLEPVKEAE